MEPLSEIYARSPQEALNVAFDRAREKCLYCPAQIFVWQSTMGTDGISYGKYRYVDRNELNSRSHKIEFFDGFICIRWTDVLLNK